MKKTSALLLMLLLLCLAPIESRAQKEYREVKELLKKNDAKAALKKVEELAEDEVYRHDPKRMEYAIEAYLQLLEAENEKNYLKLGYDTVGNFNYTYQLFQQIIRLDAAVDGKRRKKCRAHNRKHLVYYFPNIKAAGNYFFQKKDFQEALRYLDFLKNLPQNDMAKGHIALSEKEKARVAYLCLLSMSALGNQNGVVAYAEEAVKDELGRRNVMELKSLALYELGDIKAYEAQLKEGFQTYADYPFFYNRLSDLYLKDGRFGEANALGDQMLQSGGEENAACWMTKATALMNLKRYDEAIAAGKKALSLDNSAATSMMNFVVGASYCNQALSIELPVSIHSLAYSKAVNWQKELYSLAKPHLEAYRQAAPEAVNSWAPLLYRVYLTLNLGKQFEEIEKYVN